MSPRSSGLRICLVRPPLLVPRWSDSSPITPPLGLAYLAASLRAAGHEPSIVDALGEAPFQVSERFDGRMTALGLDIDAIVALVARTRPQLLGITCMFSQDWPETRRLIAALAAALPGVPIVAGGEHVSALPEHVLASAPGVDYCVIGEGEETLVELAATLSADRTDPIPGVVARGPGGPAVGPRRGRLVELDAIPPPAWDLVPLANYLDHGLGYGVDRGRSMPILASRGCPYQCTFCSSPLMWTTRWDARDPALVVAEMERGVARYGAQNFDFYDLTAIVRRDWIRTFCELLIARGLGVTWQLPSGTRSEALDRDTTRLMAAAGCRNLSYAPESGSADVLRRIKKRVDLPRLEESVRGAVGGGLNVKLNIIMGFPDETRSELLQTVRFLARMGRAGVHDASVSLFSPYPGSELFAALVALGRLPELDDEYFLSLATYKDFGASGSHAQQVGPRELAAFRVLGMSTFYGVQFARRPSRLGQLLVHAARGREESRLDKSIQDLARRLGRRR